MPMIPDLPLLRSIPAACHAISWSLAACLVVGPAASAAPATPAGKSAGTWKARPVALADTDGSSNAADGDEARSAPGNSAPAPSAGSGATAATKAAEPSLPRHAGRVEEKRAVDAIDVKTTLDEILARTLPPRSDRPGDWEAGLEPLHRCGEPRWIEPCIPPPPCHPALPPHPGDLVGVPGEPTCGPIYGGPCCPRTGSHDDGPAPRLHRLHDRLFDAFYRTK